MMEKYFYTANRFFRGWVWIFLAVLLLVACEPDKINIDIKFSRLPGLAEGDRVLFEGNPAGKVESITYRQDGTYRVGIEVDGGYEKALTEHSRFYTAADPVRHRQQGGYHRVGPQRRPLVEGRCLGGGG